MDNLQRPQRFVWLLEYGAVALLTVILTSIVLQLWNFQFFIPNSYKGDGWAYLATIKGMIERGLTGGVLYIDRLGAPTGAMMYDSMVYQQAGLHNFVMKLIGLVVPNENFVINFYYLMSYPLISVFTYLFMREAKLARPYALLGALLYAFTPYHLYRNTVHIYLSCYYMVPLAALVFLWLAQRRLTWEEGESWRSLWRKPRFRISAAIVFVLALSDAYYTFFFLLLLGLLMAIAFLSGEKGRWRQIALMATLVGVIACGGMTLVAPTLPEKFAHPNPEANIYPLARHYYMADYNSLRLDTMIMPTLMHRISRVAASIIDYQTWVKIHGETKGASLGLIPTIGFFFSLAYVFVALRRREGSVFAAMPAGDDILLRHCSAACLWLLLIGTIGGFGTLIATLYPDIRCYIRVTIYIQLFALLIFSLILQQAVRRYWPDWQRSAGWMLAALLMAAGIFDQTASSSSFGSGDYSPNRMAVAAKIKRYDAHREFIGKVEAALPTGAMVFELPYVSFWTYNGPVGNIEYDHLVPFLHSKQLKWTYGSVVGTAVDLWQRRVARKPVADFLREIAAMGFRAVYVDREGYSDKGEAIIAQLHDNLPDDPIVSADGRYLVFKVPDPGIQVMVDAYSYDPQSLTITDRSRFKPEALPDYVKADKLMSLIAADPAPQPVLTGTKLADVIDQEMEAALSPAATMAAMPDAGFKGSVFCPADTTITVTAADKRAYLTVPVTVTNDSDLLWNFNTGRSDGFGTLSLRSHLLDARRQMKDADFNYHVTLSAPIRPHTSRTIQAVFEADFLRKLEGVHYLQLDVVQEGVAWLAGKHGGSICTIKIINTETLLDR